MSDLVKRLRVWAKTDTATSEFAPDEHIAWQAADRIAELEAENEALRKRVERLENGYREAIEDISGWGVYASDYFQKKHDLSGTIANHCATIALKPQDEDDEQND